MTAYAVGRGVDLRGLLAAIRSEPGSGPSAQAQQRHRTAPRPRSPHEDARVDGVDGVDGSDGGAPPRRPEPDDEVWPLVRRAQQGDTEAFAGLYDRYVNLIHRYIYCRVGDRALAEDFTSETFLRALRRISSLANTGRDPGAWFVTIARNIVLDHVKSSRYRLEITTDDLYDADPTDHISDGPEDSVLDKLTNATLLECVRQLGTEQQECIALRFLHGLSVAETAEAMGKNEGAVKALQHRAVRRLGALVPRSLR